MLGGQHVGLSTGSRAAVFQCEAPRLQLQTLPLGLELETTRLYLSYAHS